MANFERKAGRRIGAARAKMSARSKESMPYKGGIVVCGRTFGMPRVGGLAGRLANDYELGLSR
jgi:hypothetical protein